MERERIGLLASPSEDFWEARYAKAFSVLIFESLAVHPRGGPSCSPSTAPSFFAFDLVPAGSK